jgi:hypothetical protein
MDPKMLALLGDRRFRCFVQILKGGRCDMINIDVDRLLAGDEGEKEKVYKFLPELNEIRKYGYDIVGKLIELVNRLRSERISDVAAALVVAINTMFGGQISEEDARRIGEMVQMVECVQFDQGWVEVDSQCLEKFDVPQELKDKFRMLTIANLVWA